MSTYASCEVINDIQVSRVSMNSAQHQHDRRRDTTSREPCRGTTRPSKARQSMKYYRSLRFDWPPACFGNARQEQAHARREHDERTKQDRAAVVARGGVDQRPSNRRADERAHAGTRERDTHARADARDVRCEARDGRRAHRDERAERAAVEHAEGRQPADGVDGEPAEREDSTRTRGGDVCVERASAVCEEGRQKAAGDGGGVEQNEEVEREVVRCACVRRGICSHEEVRYCSGKSDTRANSEKQETHRIRP